MSTAAILPLRNNDHALAGHADFRQDVSGENDRVISRKTLDQFADFNNLVGIKSDCWLVENQDFRIVHQALGRDPRAVCIP